MQKKTTYILENITKKTRPIILARNYTVSSIQAEIASIMCTCNNSLSLCQILHKSGYYRRPIIEMPDRIVVYTQAAESLHNYLHITECSLYCPPRYADREDGAGNIIDVGWKRDEEACIGLQDVSHGQAVILIHLL